jgi:hypothetical protein
LLEKKLNAFIGKIIKESFEAFRTEVDEGRELRKWAVLHLLNTTKGKKK